MPTKLKIEHWAIDKLKPYGRNPRKNDAAVDRMTASIQEFGFSVPILIKSDGEIIAGHLRTKAARKLGMKQLPVIICDSWTDAQVKAFRLMENKSVTWAEWDADLLKLEFADLKAVDFNLNLTGFDAKELSAYTMPAVEEMMEEGETTETPAISKKGDLFALGRHRLLCGDSSDICQVEKVLAGAKPELLLYDPPYEIEEAWSWAYPCDRALIFTDYQHIKEPWSIARSYAEIMQFIWDFGTSQYTHSRPLQQHRTCLYCSNDAQWIRERAIYSDDVERKGYKGGRTEWGDYQYDPLPAGCRYLATIYREGYRSAVIGNGLHGKPVDWIRCLIGGSGAKTVLDMFAGSGTALIAAPEDVTVYAVELDERKVDGCLARWERYARLKARLVIDNECHMIADSAENPDPIRANNDHNRNNKRKASHAIQ